MTLISVPIKTFSAEDLVKLNILLCVHYSSDIPKAIQVITETINSFDFVKEKENTKVFVTNF
jgi:spermidine/putrescine-binding protein